MFQTTHVECLPQGGEKTMPEPLRVVHYLNQFFAGFGGEEQANLPVQVLREPVGPGRLLQQLLGARGEVVGTIVAGDNYVNEQQTTALSEVLAAVAELQPTVVILGPAFDAGRYGLACAVLGGAIMARCGLPAVSGMAPENPGVLVERGDLYIIPTGSTANDMAEALTRMQALALNLGRGEEIGPAQQAGYLPRGYRRPVTHDRSAAQRAVDMLVARLSDHPWQTEIPVMPYDAITPVPPLADVRQATIGLVTSGGLVPRGNPDHQVSGGARQCFRYAIEDLDALRVADWESVHGGFNPSVLNTHNPNYALPVHTVRELEADGVIGSVYPYFYSTVGNGTMVSVAKQMAEEIGADFKAGGVDAVLLVAT
jgi:betaine reductase